MTQPAMQLPDPALVQAPVASRRAIWLQFALFIVIALILIGTNWPVISTVNFELGDFAANSLLIQDAKSLTLLKGNYSRVGFNHPGPAILYVLAFGEAVFHDWLHIAASPLSGQLMAVAVYAAFWLVMLYWVMRRVAGAAVPALLTVAVFALMAAYLDHHVFTGMWFPHLYFLPFAVMLAAASRLVDGHTDTLPVLALACGFLVNGHVSFVAILGILLATVAAANYWLRRSQPFLLSKEFFKGQRRALTVFAGLFAIFLLPLLLETVLDFPGPIGKYASFGRHNKANTLGQAVSYMAAYWGGQPWSLPAAAGGAGLLLAAGRWMRDDFGRGVRALVVLFVGATLALVFYAKVGIDLLEHKYIGLFYYAVPALMIAIMVASLYHVAAVRGKQTAGVLLALLCAGLAARQISQPPEYLHQYNNPAVQDWYRSMKALPQSQGRLVLDLDYAQEDQGLVWSNTLGLQAYAKRRHDDFICINGNWHISHTVEQRCSADEVARGQHYLVQRFLADRPAPDAQGLGMAVYKVVQPIVDAQSELTIASQPETFSKYLLSSGWSVLEPSHVWSEGRDARLSIQLAPNFSGVIALDLAAFVPRPDYVQEVTIDAGQATKSVTFSQAEQRKRIEVPLRADANGRLVVSLHIARPISPKKAGLSDDGRKLGVALYGLKIEGK
jgi:hypothetical protein